VQWVRIGGIWFFAALFLANGLNLSIMLARIFDVSPFAVGGTLVLVLVVILAWLRSCTIGAGHSLV
jgi:hypothetical protein